MDQRISRLDLSIYADDIRIDYTCTQTRCRAAYVQRGSLFSLLFDYHNICGALLLAIPHPDRDVCKSSSDASKRLPLGRHKHLCDAACHNPDSLVAKALSGIKSGIGTISRYFFHKWYWFINSMTAMHIFPAIRILLNHGLG